jgi:hypothetical protein
MRNFIRTLLVLSTIVLTSILSLAQNAPQTLRDKFLKETTHTSSQPAKASKGFFTPFKAGFYVSTAVCVGGAAADIASSLGKQELNPIVRNDRGQLNVGRAILLKGASCGWPALIERRHPRMAFWIRTITGIGWSVIAGRN